MSSIALVTMLSSTSVLADSDKRVRARIKQADTNHQSSNAKDRRYRRDSNSNRRNSDRRSDRNSDRHTSRRSDRNSRNRSRHDRQRDGYRHRNSNRQHNSYNQRRNRSHRSKQYYGVNIYNSYNSGVNCRYVYNRYDERVKRCYPKRYSSHYDSGQRYGYRYHDRYGNYYDSYRRGRYTRNNHRGHSRHNHYYDNKIGQWVALAVLFDVLLDD